MKFSMEVLVWVLRHARYKIWVTANSISLNFELKKCIRFIVMPFSLPRISSSAVFLAYDIIVSHLYKMGTTVILFSFTCIYYRNLEYFLCEKCVRLYRLLFSIFIAAWNIDNCKDNFQTSRVLSFYNFNVDHIVMPSHGLKESNGT